MTAIILDTETHTLYGCPIEIAYVPVQISQGGLQVHREAMIDQLYSLDDGVEIDLTSMAVHHILPTDLIGQPHYRTFRLPAGIEYIIGHNIAYDLGALALTGQDVTQLKPICTLALARELWPQLSSHNLSVISFMASSDWQRTRDLLRQAHHADTDVLLTADVLNTLIRQLCITDFEQLYQRSQAARLPKVMPFGKHRGQPLHQVPADYIYWLLGQDNVDPTLREALTLVVQQR